MTPTEKLAREWYPPGSKDSFVFCKPCYETGTKTFLSLKHTSDPRCLSCRYSQRGEEIIHLVALLSSAREHIKAELVAERGEDWKECYCSDRHRPCSICFLAEPEEGAGTEEGSNG